MDKNYSKISYCPTCNGSNEEHAAKCSWCGNQFMNTSSDSERPYMENIISWCRTKVKSDSDISLINSQIESTLKVSQAIFGANRNLKP